MGHVLALTIIALDGYAAFLVAKRWWVAAIVMGIALAYAWLGERLTTFKIKKVKKRRLTEGEQYKLLQIRMLLNQRGRKLGINTNKYKIHVVQSSQYNAYCYGKKNIAVTRRLLLEMPADTICAVLAHEIGHARHGDMLFSRVLYMNVSIGLLFLTGLKIAALCFLTGSVVAAFLCAGILSGVAALCISRLLNYSVHIAEQYIRWLMCTTYNILNAAYSRSCEYAADRFSCKMGFAYELRTFLGMFKKKRFWLFSLPSTEDLLYGTHPPNKRRIKKLQKLEKKQEALQK